MRMCMYILPPNAPYCYRPQRSWGKVMFLQVCVILFTGVEYLTRYPPGPGTPPGPDTPPQDQVHLPRDQVHPPRTRYTPQDQVHPLGPGTTPGTRYTHPGPGTPPRTRYTLGTRYTPPDQVPPRLIKKFLIQIFLNSNFFLIQIFFNSTFF